ncbi:right-handed parallel beta-helix repeat-containing protein, partial [candidate division WOR-3 bacterium]|nr:right-handed parallel beta-helix repeat-containing protein [candidate division WOR-3 bacterium]
MKKVLTLILISLMFFSFKVTLAKGEFIVTNTNSRGAGSFLYAIREAIDKGGVVKFDIPEEDKNFNGKVWIIKLKDPIPEMNKPVIIDGLSQTEKYGDRNPDGPEIVIDASMVAGEETLFYFRKSGFEISGITMINFKGKGVVETKQAKGSVHDVSIRNADIGVYLYKASGVKIKNVSVSNLKYGLYLYYSNFNVIENIHAENCDYGIRFYYSMNNEIKDSTVVKCNSGIRIFYNSIKNKIHDNKILENIDGIWVRDPHNIENDIFDNEFMENVNGIHLLYGTKVQIYSNKFNKNNTGIFIESFSEKNKVFENSFTNNNTCIDISNHSKNNVLRGNIFDSNKKAIFIDEETSIPNTLSENIITNNDYRGIMINSNNKTPPPKILNVGLVGKGIAMEVENEVDGT